MKIETNSSSARTQPRILARLLLAACTGVFLASAGFAANAQYQPNKPSPYQYKKPAATPKTYQSINRGDLSKPGVVKPAPRPVCAEGFTVQGKTRPYGQDSQYECVRTFQMQCADMGPDTAGHNMRIKQKGSVSTQAPANNKPTVIAYTCMNYYN